MQCNAMQCNAMQCSAMQCNAMQCNAILVSHGKTYSIHFFTKRKILTALQHCRVGVCVTIYIAKVVIMVI